MEIKFPNDTKTIEPTTTEPSKPYLAQKMSNGTDYYPLAIYSSGEGVKIKGNEIEYVIQEKIEALKFSSDSNFTLSATKKWDGTLEYTLDNGGTWTTWDGSQLSGTASQPIYLRGTGNTKITGGQYPWTFTGKYCTGNIETLLDYNTVKNGGHPTMADRCYEYMFQSCTSLTTAPELPATILARTCYHSMFKNCTSLTTAPELPATTLADYCYSEMFSNCSSFTEPPALPTTTLAKGCYYRMFYMCRSLNKVPYLSATTLPDECYMEMFDECSSLKLYNSSGDGHTIVYNLPTSGIAVAGTNSSKSMFAHTGGDILVAYINRTFYVENEPV